MRKSSPYFIFMAMAFLMTAPMAYACSSCGCTVCLLGKGRTALGQGQKWYFKYLYEQEKWHEKSAREANELQNDGHDVHDKTTENTHHFELGRHFTDDFSVFVDLPYVVRNAVEISDSDNLGAKQTSQGVGDLQLIGDYRFWHDNNNALSLAGGLKFPTGDTHVKDSAGGRFETDMQPGSGAYNYIVGGIYKMQSGRVSVTANTSYVFTTKGAQGFEFGDLFAASVYGVYLFNPGSKHFRTHVGVDAVYQDEQKEKTGAKKNPDSGGQMVLIGPAFRVDTSRYLSFTGSFLYPVYRDLNGLTQKLDLEWTLAGEVRF